MRPADQPPLEYDSRLTSAAGTPFYLEGSTLWARDRATLPSLCVRCGQEAGLIRRTYRLRNSSLSFDYFCCPCVDAAGPSYKVLAAISVTHLTLVAAFVAAYLGLVTPTILMPTIGLIGLVLYCLLALVRSSRLFEIRGHRPQVFFRSRLGGYFGVIDLSPVLLSQVAADAVIPDAQPRDRDVKA